jgi:uncharacterized protein (DUF58 family)
MTGAAAPATPKGRATRPSLLIPFIRRQRSKAQPGPGPTPPAVLRAIDLSLRRRIDGLLPGEHRAAALGMGTELAQVRPYQPGDDVRRIDWNVTARTRVPHVRVHVAERATVTWLVLDVSPSMAFGTADRRKADVVEGVALAVGYVATRRGNRLGMVTFGGEHPRTSPPRAGQVGMLALHRQLLQEPPAEGSGPTQLGEALRRTDRLARRRGVVVVVSDFRGPREWRQPLRQLAGRHDVLAVEVGDPRELDLPDVGEVTFVDPESGRELRVDTGDRKLRERFAAAASVERQEVALELQNAGIEHIVLSTSGEWLRPFVRSLRMAARTTTIRPAK